MLTTSESERALYIGRTKRTRQMHVNILNVRKYTTFVRGGYAFTVNAFENRRVFVDAKLFFFRIAPLWQQIKANTDVKQ